MIVGTKYRIGEAVTEPEAASWRRNLGDVVTELLEGDADERQRLAKAVASYRVALTAYRGWPAGLRAASDALRAKLVVGGRFEATVAGLGEERLRDVSDELWRFCQTALADDGGVPTNGKADDVDGIDKLRQAKALLASDGRHRGTLRAAAHLFWSAEFYCESWPAGLRTMAESLTAKIFRHGPIDAAMLRMSDAAADEVKRDLLRLCEEAERLRTAFAGTNSAPHVL